MANSVNVALDTWLPVVPAGRLLKLNLTKVVSVIELLADALTSAEPLVPC